MYLKEVIAHGFKSFADRTRIELGAGITTIVGPNGCGKSNVVDAIRWVLGEQSAKALRGGKMQDVIFAGTDSRPASTQCEVSLVFADCEKELGTAYNEVEVTRRVSLEGSSDYYINGKACRLRDIQELFMDTGVGRESYSFMMQGQIDKILSNNPSERRIIFEEAAGITRYKTQRREALNKLAQVDGNLARVSDILEEVKRQMGTLKRQASKAIRFKKIQHRLTHLELGLLGYQFSQKWTGVQELDKKTEALREIVESAALTLGDKEQMVEQKKAERTVFYEQLQEAQQAVFDVKSQKDQLENQVHLADLRKKDAEGRIEDLAAEIKNLQTEIQNIEEKVASDQQVKQLQLNLVDSSDNEYKKRAQDVQEVENRLREAEGGLQEKRKRLIELEGGIQRLQSRSNQLQVELKTDEAKTRDLEDKKRDYQAKEQELQEQLAEVKRQFEEKNEAYAKAQAGVDEAQKGLVAQKESFKAAQKEVQEQERNVGRLNAQLGILEDLQSKLEGFSEGAKSLLQGKLKGVVESEHLHLLTKGVVIEEAYTKRMELLMGQAIDAIALTEGESVSSIAQAMKDKDFGRACIQVAFKKNASKPAGKSPKCLVPAINVVNLEDSTIRGHWELFLEDCYFAESLEEFVEYWQANPEFAFRLIATETGELIDSRGLVYLGSVKKKGNEPSFIKREAEIKALSKTLDKEKKKLAELNEKGNAGQEEVNQAEEALEALRKEFSDLNHEVSRLRGELRSAQNAVEFNERSLKSAVEQYERIQSTQGQTGEKLKAAQEELGREQSEISLLREVLQEKESAISGLREERDARREALSEVRIDLMEKKQRLDLIDQGLGEVEQRRKQIERRMHQCERDIEKFKDKIDECLKNAEESKHAVKQMEITLQEQTTMLSEKKERVVALEGIIKEEESQLGEQRKDLHKREGELKDLDIRLAKEQSQLKFIKEKAQSDYETDVQNINWKQELWRADELFELKINLDDIDPEEFNPAEIQSKHGHRDPSLEELAALDTTDWSVVEGEVKQLREKINSMGAVNLVAIEEYAELRDRFDFLTNQSNDLTSAKNQLLEAIEEINKTSQALFRETFEKVRDNFRVTFEKLFGGGQADLILQESEDELESGIDIIARPPGTKLKSLTLLSGGQKTMTAVALLFAIYQVKPSPFCVLDELDAPLDDANIGRFTDMLKAFTAYSQFLVISHNKRTISVSDVIYGVTMQEKGVTRLLSMKFSKKENQVVEEREEALVGV